MSSTLSINSNISSLKAQRQLGRAISSLSCSFEKLSSGLRINNASDDAAGLAISESLKTSTRVFTQAVRNLSDGFSYLSIGEGALRELSNITTRQIELAEQSANGVFTLTQRRSMDTEANALSDEFNRIVQSTDFNGRSILDLSENGGTLVLQGGYGTADALQIEVGNEFSRIVGDGTIGEATTYTMENVGSDGISLADVDNNGVLDVVTSGCMWDGSLHGYATIRLGNGDGTFRKDLSYQMEDWETWALSLSDVDNNGVLDLVTAGDTGGTGLGPGGVTIRLGNGDGTFKKALSYETEGFESLALSLSDLDNNGVLDLVTTGIAAGGGTATIRLGNGDGTFKKSLSYQMELFESCALSLTDVDSNGVLDLITAGNGWPNGGATTIRLGNGDGTFRASLSYRTEGYRSNALFLEDLDHNGVLDLVTAGQWTNVGGGGFATIRLGNGDGTFKAALSYQMEISLSSALSISDIDGNGVPDLITAGKDPTKGYSTIRLGNGDGTFRSALSYQTDSSCSRALSISDIDSNGALDLITAGVGITIRLGTPVQVTTMPRLNLLSQKDARASLDFLTNQLSRISSELGAFGSFESRLGVASNVLLVFRENFMAADSRIEDADIAAESALLARNRILHQAASSVLAQANQAPALALRLLQD